MTVQILQGNVLDTLKSIAPGSVRCVVTSPPYYGLRSYLRVDDPLKEFEIGSEETPDLYIKKMLDVFRLVWDALADDGSLWLNLGDSYAGSGKGPTGKNWIGDQELRQGFSSRGAKIGSLHGDSGHTSGVTPPIGWKAKDLYMIPARVAIALQQDGWYLRSEIVWHKPNPMPESVQDRPTRSHEMIYLLVKSAKYYYDAEAIQEPANWGEWGSRLDGIRTHKNIQDDGQQPNSFHLTRAAGEKDLIYTSRNKRDVWTVTTKPYSGAHFATFPPDLIEPCILAGSAVGDTVLDPFGGSGTTASVAIKHHRKAILCELNQDYVALIEKRMRETQPVLFGVTA